MFLYVFSHYSPVGRKNKSLGEWCTEVVIMEIIIIARTTSLLFVDVVFVYSESSAHAAEKGRKRGSKRFPTRVQSGRKEHGRMARHTIE